MNPRIATKEKVTAKHFAAREGLTLVEPLPARRAAVSKAEAPAAGDADRQENNLHRAIVVGAVLILLLVAVAYYFRFAAPSDPTDSLPPLEIGTTPHR